MRVELAAKGSLERGTIAVFESEDRHVRLEMLVAMDCFPDGEAMPSTLTVEVSGLNPRTLTSDLLEDR